MALHYLASIETIVSVNWSIMIGFQADSLLFTKSSKHLLPKKSWTALHDDLQRATGGGLPDRFPTFISLYETTVP